MLKMLGIGVGVLSLVAFVACAEGPKVEGDVSSLTTSGEENASEPAPERASLPAPTNPTPTNNSQPTPQKDAGSSTPPSNDAGSSSGSPAAGEDCPMDPLYIAKLAFTSNPPACPCAAGMCCVQGAGCVAK